MQGAAVLLNRGDDVTVSAVGSIHSAWIGRKRSIGVDHFIEWLSCPAMPRTHLAP